MISNVGEVDALDKYTNEVLYLKLYSNNLVPGETDTAASYTEVTGGGYAQKTLATADRTIVAGNPSTCTYSLQTILFTSAPTVPTVYGYFIVNGAGTLKGSERFPEVILPFTPVADGRVDIIPTLKAS